MQVLKQRVLKTRVFYKSNETSIKHVFNKTCNVFYSPGHESSAVFDRLSVETKLWSDFVVVDILTVLVNPKMVFLYTKTHVLLHTLV